MTGERRPGILCSTGLLVVLTGTPCDRAGTGSSTAQTDRRPAERPVGLDVFGGAGVSFPAAKDSFEAVDLNSTDFEVGGGARVTGLWRGTVRAGGHFTMDRRRRTGVCRLGRHASFRLEYHSRSRRPTSMRRSA